MRCLSSAVVVLILGTLATSANAADIQVGKVLLTLIDDIEVPAKKAGVLSKVDVRVGSVVKVGAPLATLDDRKAQLELKRSKTEYKIAGERAANDAQVRFARKAKEVAEVELQRAESANRRFPGSVSESRIDELRLAVARASAEIEVKTQELAIAKMTKQLKDTLVKVAENDVDARKIASPINGMVIEVKRKAGEWVEPGEKVFRVVRLDTLRVKGFIKAADTGPNLVGSRVRVTVRLANGTPRTVYGKLVFVNPLIDPNKKDVAVIAEVPNRDGRLQPGLQGSMTITPKADRRR